MRAVNICIPGVLDGADSYGIVACSLVRELDRMGVQPNVFGLMGETFQTTPDDVRAIVSRPVAAALGGLFLGYPTGYVRHRNPLVHIGPRVALTMFESSKLPAGWADVLNQMDAVVVPSWFCWETFRQARVTAAMHVVPLGLSDVYRPAARRTGRPLTFLAFLDRGKRKGGLVALQAFLRAFGDDPNYRLILKSRNARVQIELANDNITVIQRDMTDEELYRLYLEADVLVSPNRGEGFGLPPREFAATGGISLVTNWGGTADDLSAWGWALPYALVSADWSGIKSLEGQDLGVWAEPDVDGITRALTQVAAHRDWYREQAYARAEHVRRMYNWQRAAAEIMAIYERAGGYGRRHQQAA